MIINWQTGAWQIVAGPTVIVAVSAESVELVLVWTIETNGAMPIENAKVWLSTGDYYTVANLVPDSIKRTDIDGNVAYVLIPDVEYWGWRTHKHYTFADPFRFRFNSALSRWEKFVSGTYIAWTP